MQWNQWSIFVAIHRVSLAHINDVCTILRMERRWFFLLCLYDICNIGDCHLLLEIFVRVVQFRLQFRLTAFRKKTRIYVVYISHWFCINQHSNWDGNTVCHINHSCHYPINIAWNERLSVTDNLRNLFYSSTIYWAISLLRNVICFNLLLVLLLPRIAELLCKGIYALYPLSYAESTVQAV